MTWIHCIIQVCEPDNDLSSDPGEPLLSTSRHFVLAGMIPYSGSAEEKLPPSWIVIY